MILEGINVYVGTDRFDNDGACRMITQYFPCEKVLKEKVVYEYTRSLKNGKYQWLLIQEVFINNETGETTHKCIFEKNKEKTRLELNVEAKPVKSTKKKTITDGMDIVFFDEMLPVDVGH